MADIFNQVQYGKTKRNLFPLSHERKFSMNMGDLTPILCEEVLPGDKWKGNSEALIRMAPMLAPIMHRLNVTTHFFFVPNRLVWNEWEDFITGGPNGTSNPVLPYFNAQGQYGLTYSGSLADYLGCATSDKTGSENAAINALPFRAYQNIYNEYYRDQDLESEIPINLDSGHDTGLTSLTTLRKRAWEKDMFTSARPFTQKGGEVEVPLLGTAPVTLNNDTSPWLVKKTDGTNATNSDLTANLGVLTGAENLKLDPVDTLSADLTSSTSTTIKDLRIAARTQEWLEKNARGGSRYIESMLIHFGVKSSDARLQRPEYLGGGKVPMMISETLQTSETATSPQGNMAGHGVSAGSSPKFNAYFEEHGYIIGIMSVMPKTSYYQGFRRHLLKNDKFDYFWKDFEQIGEQAIYNAELYHSYLDPVNKGTFGYTPRYAEYKYIPSSVHGDMRNSLEYWHMGRKFANLPTLNEDFVISNPTDRIFAVQDESHKLYCQVYNDLLAIRPMSKFATPKL